MNKHTLAAAVIEFVRDGSTFRAILLPSFEVVMVAISGIKCPAVNRDDEKDSPEHALEARYCLESRLLQRDVKLLFEGVSNQQLVLATVIHPAGNIAELLLKGGYAKCVDWSMAVVTTGKEKLRSAERYAKEKKLRLWKDYQPSSVSNVPIKCKAFSGKVVEVVNGDALVVKAPDAGFQKIFLSSLRSPKPKENGGSGSTDTSSHSSSQRVRPLYDVPYMFEAREFLRKKLVGKKVNVTVDYIKPAQDAFPERTFCTVTRDGINIAEALISKGFGTCLKHRQDDDQRSSVYDDLMASEAKAKKNGKGLHSQKDTPSHRVADVSGDLAKSKQFLPFLQRAGKTVAIVEFVASGSRARLYLPKDTCLITFLLAGVSCPRAPRIADGPGMAAEPFGEEALLFTKELILQKEVEVEVEACDKRGNFIGWMYVDGKNLSLSLVEEGLSKVSPQADRSSHGNVLYAAEEKARAARKKLWEDYVEKEEEEQEGEESKEEEAEPSKPAERKTNYQEVIVTEVLSCNRFYSQFVDQGPKLDQLMDQLRSEFTLHPPLPGSFTPRKGMLCAALFSDQMWYRAMIERVSPKKDAEVLYIDFGNRETVPLSKLAALPSSYTGLQAQAKEFYLACVASPPDEDWSKEAFTVFRDQVLNAPMKVNVEYKSQGQEYVTLVDCEDDSDVGESLIHEGLVRVERRKDRRVTSLIERYIKAEEEARKARKSMWCYGDITPDDAKEFGYQK